MYKPKCINCNATSKNLPACALKSAHRRSVDWQYRLETNSDNAFALQQTYVDTPEFFPNVSKTANNNAVFEQLVKSPDKNKLSFVNNYYCDESKIKILRNTDGTTVEKCSSVVTPKNSFIHSNMLPATPPTYLKPFHVRLSEYNSKRNEIFNEPIPSLRQKRSAERIRTFWNSVNHTRRGLLSTIFDKPNDVRPYAEVKIFDRNMVGLLDTGASVSCLGSETARAFLDSDHKFKKIRSTVRTADGKKQDVVGVVEVDISFRGETRKLKLYIHCFRICTWV